jgi:hypothetical protein
MGDTPPADSPRPNKPWTRGRIALVVLVPLCLVGGFLLWAFWPPPSPPTTPSTFDSSEKYPRTLIVPTLDAPVPYGKNVIWCSSLQLAWNKLKSEIVKGPVELDQWQEVADRLNTAVQSEADLPEDAYYAAAGWDSHGIQNEIRTEMARRFPGVMVNLPPPSRTDGVAYAYLQAQVKFTRPYHEYSPAFQFARGRIVKGFGLDPQYPGSPQLCDQVEVFYATAGRRGQMQEYAVDLCRDSRPNQLVAAMVQPGTNLAECLARHHAMMTGQPMDVGGKRLLPDDELRVPNTSWRIEHHFSELEGRRIQSPEGLLFLKTAIQSIDFRLDRTGAAISSESRIDVDKKGGIIGPRLFYFDRPFLLVMKKRNAEHPFFVMWIDNDELLQ